MRIFLFVIILIQCTVLHAQTTTKRTSFDAYTTKVKLPNVKLRDRHNVEHDLQTLMQDKIVIMDFVFTSCTTVCPVLSAIMSNTEKKIAHRLGDEVILVSVSVDPANDTPDKLSDHANKFDAGSNWYWLTGSQGDINQTLRAFGIPVGGRPEDHPPVILVGNKHKDRWFRWVGIPEPDSLINAINSFSNDS